MKLVKETDNQQIKKVSDQDAEEAFRTILTWMGEDPAREGLLETPKRVTKAFKEYFAGYAEDANKILEKKLSVRQAETFVKIFKNKKIKSNKTKDTNIIALELSISNKIGINVDIQNNNRNKGKISFEYKDLDQLNKIIDIIKSNY